MLIAQISDCHIMEPGEAFGGHLDSAAGLRAAIDALHDLPRRPDVVLATGDLVNDGRSAQYDHLATLLAPLGLPLIPMIGNHDDRAEFRARFSDVVPSGGPDEPLDVVIDDFEVRIVALDTTIPGQHGGALATAQLGWLDERLAEHPDRPTVVVQHHPPFESGIRWMDRGSGFASSDAESAVIEKHPHVEAVLAGHLHRAITCRFAGTVAMTCPSTAAALDLDLVSAEVGYSSEPTGFLLHEWARGTLTTHVVAIDGQRRWIPDWVD